MGTVSSWRSLIEDDQDHWHGLYRGSSVRLKYGTGEGSPKQNIRVMQHHFLADPVNPAHHSARLGARNGDICESRTAAWQVLAIE